MGSLCASARGEDLAFLEGAAAAEAASPPGQRLPSRRWAASAYRVAPSTRSLPEGQCGSPTLPEAERRLWEAARDGRVEDVRQALKDGASAECVWEATWTDALVYKTRRLSCQPIHVAAHFRPKTMQVQVPPDVPVSGRWRDERSTNNPFFGRATICIKANTWVAEGMEDAADFRRSRSDRKKFIEERDDRSIRIFEMSIQADGCLKVMYPGFAWTLSPVLDDAAASKSSPKTSAPPANAAKEIVELLLKGRASPSAMAESVTANKEGNEHRKLCPIHLAAAAENLEVIRLLVEYKASPHAQATKDGELQYYPIHDAVWFNRRASVSCLVEQKAELEATNDLGDTGMHLAAQLGYVQLVRYFLVNSDAPGELLQRKNRVKCTPLDKAIKDGRFPPRDLYLFVQDLSNLGRAQAFFKVANACPSAASELLRDREPGSEDSLVLSLAPISDEWRRSLREGAKQETLKVGMLALLIEKAPRAALDLLDALTDTPEVASHQHHPLPIRATLPKGMGSCPVSFAYEEDERWEWNRNDKENGNVPWQDKLAPVTPKGQEVQVRIVNMKGIASLQVLHALALAPDQRVFSKLAIHGLLHFAWSRLQYLFLIDLVHEIVTLVALSCWILGSKERRILDMPFTHCSLWVILASQGLHQWVAFALGLWASISYLGTSETMRRILQLHTWFRLVFGGITLLLAILSLPGLWPEGELSDAVLAANSLLHWGNLLFQLRAFRWTGQRLLPIARSVQPIAGMLVIMAALLLAFMHGFWANEPNSADEIMLYKVASMLLTGNTFLDSEELAAMAPARRAFMILLTLGAIFVFLNCALSVFIAVLGDCYDIEQERMVITFLSERSRICCGLYAGPTLPMPPLAAALALALVGAAYLVALVAAAYGLGSSQRPLLFAWVPAVLLAGSILLAQAALRASLVAGWEARYLWLCHEPNGEEEGLFMAPDEFDLAENQGRLCRIKRYIFEHGRMVKRENEVLSQQCKAVASSVETVKGDIGTVLKWQEEIKQRHSDLEERHSRVEGLCTSMQASMHEVLQVLGNLSRQRPAEPRDPPGRLQPGPPQSHAERLSASAPLGAASPSRSPVRTPLAASLQHRPAQRRTGPPSGPPRALPARRAGGALWIEGFPGEYAVMNGMYKLAPSLQAGRPHWASTQEPPYYLFHTGTGRWVLTRTAGDSSTCYAYVEDDGTESPAGCRGPWMRRNESLRFEPDSALACTEVEAPCAVSALKIEGCTGKYALINGVYGLRRDLHAGMPCWFLPSPRGCFLFHNGSSRWFISRTCGDASACYAYVADDGGEGPATCAGPWMRCDDKGNWHEEPALTCVEQPG